MSKYLLLILLTVSDIVSHGQETIDTSLRINHVFSVQELKQDLAILKDSLRILHPALYRHTSKELFDAAFKTADKNVDKPMSLSDFYSIVAPLAGKVGDIHTTVDLPDEYYNQLATKSDLFPFDVRIIDGEVFIASNNSLDSTIKVGSKIFSINDQPIKNVLQKMESYFSGEGDNVTLKIRRVEQRFAFQYHIAYGYTKEFKIQYAKAGQLQQTKKTLALPFLTIRANRVKNQIDYPYLKPLFVQPPYLTLSIKKEKQTAILTIKWFQDDVLEGVGERFKPFIDSAFLEINKANIRNLVIDIRKNEGGQPENASYLYSYLTNKPFNFFQFLEANKKTHENDIKKGVVYSYMKDSGKYRTRDSSMAVKFPTYFGFNIQQPQANNFAGNVFVLIDGLTISAAPQFASLVKLNKRGMLIGEEAPGSLYGGSGRGYAYFLLPNTRILTMISLYRVVIANEKNKLKDIRIVPNYRATSSIDDLLNGIDKEMELTMKLIGANK
ncbi:MAG TPA: S41 family peptidase [Chitinophagaceae bacterium]|nr:S41 family peptidase [Chitinophagaceae bacterium]